MEKQFGLNLFTFGFIGTIVMTIVSAWGLFKQQRAISDNPEKQGQSVSAIVFIFLVGISITQLAYAKFENWDMALIFNGVVRGIAYFLIVMAIRGVRQFNRKEILTLIATGIITIISVIAPRPDLWFIALTAIVIIVSLDQPWQIFKEKSPGVVSFKLLITLLTSTSFWIIYAFAADMLVMKFISPAYFMIVIITMVVWLIYRDKDQRML